ncbi:MAG: ATP-binding cassette domain-containing protein [Clostridia bacterium]
MTVILSGGPYHANTFEYYERFFDLSEEPEGNDTELPTDGSIEFRDVWFRYPGTDQDILKGLSFKIQDGEKVSIVGENGEGKTTMIKLLLGLFTPDKGEILVGGQSMDDLRSSSKISQLYGTVFQDFMRYNMTVKENIAVGDIHHTYHRTSNPGSGTKCWRL